MTYITRQPKTRDWLQELIDQENATAVAVDSAPFTIQVYAWTVQNRNEISYSAFDGILNMDGIYAYDTISDLDTKIYEHLSWFIYADETTDDYDRSVLLVDAMS